MSMQTLVELEAVPWTPTTLKGPRNSTQLFLGGATKRNNACSLRSAEAKLQALNLSANRRGQPDASMSLLSSLNCQCDFLVATFLLVPV